MKKIMLIVLMGALASCMQLEYIEVTVEQEKIPLDFETKLQMDRHEFARAGISYYEAILICNIISLEEGLDSLYRHDEPEFINDSIFWLPNIEVLENLAGYRLPTKEEWLLAYENGEIEKLDESIGEWLYSEASSQYSAFELAPHFLKTVGLYKEREGYPVYGMRLLRVF